MRWIDKFGLAFFMLSSLAALVVVLLGCIYIATHVSPVLVLIVFPVAASVVLATFSP